MASRKWVWRGVALAVALFAAGVCAVLYFGPRPGAGKLTPDEARELVALKNFGLGYLENQKLPESLESFETIAQRVPGDPFGRRNLAAARVLALGIEFEPAEPALVAAAKAALAELARVEGENAAGHWLGLRVAMAEKDFAAAQTHLAWLLESNPRDPAGWYAKYRVSTIADPQQSNPQGAAALDKALELSPANVWLLVEWLRSFAGEIRAASAGLPQGEPARAAAIQTLVTRFEPVARRLDSAPAAVQPFAHVIQTHTNIDALAFVNEAAAALRQGDFAKAAGRMHVLANVLSPHSPADQLPLRKHPLEFVLDRFAPEFYAQAQIAEEQQDPAIPVAFTVNAGWQVPAELQEQLGQARDIALADFDLDGRLDVVALSEKSVVVWSRKDAAQSWQQIAAAQVEGGQRVIVQDLDADFDETRAAVHGSKPPPPGQVPPAIKGVCPTADVDLLVVGTSGAAVLENRHDPASGARTLVALDTAKLPPLTGEVRTATCADLNADGDLDVVLATPAGLQLWSSGGGWTFVDISARSALPEDLTDAAGLLAFDFDRDVDIDVLVAAPSGGGWLENLRHGQFRWRPFADEFPVVAGAAAVEITDMLGNASWDVIAAGKDKIQLAITDTPTSGLVKSSRTDEIAALAATRLVTWDYDNDGFEDLLAWSNAERRLFRGLTGGKFAAADLLAALPPAIDAAEVGDLDGDGDQDLAVLAAGRVQLAENQGGNQHHWIDVALQAQQIKDRQISPSGRVSPYGVGSLLELKAGPRYQAKIVRGQSTHFGLGKQPQADVVRVAWLNGIPQNVIRPAADSFLCEPQILNTSCPYLYAWDGEQFVFVTDLLWNAPLGLQLAEGQLAPWRDWEYLKIPGRQLVPKDGHYVLQVTAELWEADYFDEVRLIAVDHPADVEVYSNEKVGPPAIAQFKIHTASQPRVPLAARNHAGRDLLPELAREDGVYARTYEKKLRQGVVEDHFLELELGDLSEAEHVTLFLTGWLMPASTSLHVALSQGGDVGLPQPPSLEMPDGKSGWKSVLPFMGFPGGKTKTIAIELPISEFKVQSSKFKVGESTLNLELGTLNSVRIRTGMELYWDQIFFTVDEPPAEVRTTELPLVSADLHERGYSRVLRDDSSGPEQFLYDEVSTEPKWPPMLGRFTRLGDVRELLTKRDDRLLVMSAGDEVTLRFAVPAAPLPAGWKRDFMLYSAGWDKDANLETIVGQSSEPLPFQAMSGYPWPPTEQTPDSAEHREYLRTYQTRVQSHAYWQMFARPTLP